MRLLRRRVLRVSMHLAIVLRGWLVLGLQGLPGMLWQNDFTAHVFESMRDLVHQRRNLFRIARDDWSAQGPIGEIKHDSDDHNNHDDRLDLGQAIGEVLDAVREPIAKEEQKADAGNGINAVRQNEVKGATW